MTHKTFAIAMWLGMFCAFLWAARAPRHVVAMRRAFLLEDGPVSSVDIWILRALSVFCIGCATGPRSSAASVVLRSGSSRRPVFLHGFIELARRNVFTHVAGRYWTVRLSAGAAWAMGAFEWHEGERGIALFAAALGCSSRSGPRPSLICWPTMPAKKRR